MAKTVDRLAVLAFAARERGISYGQLIAMTSRQERDELAAETAGKLKAKIAEDQRLRKMKAPEEMPTGKVYFCVSCGVKVGPRYKYCEHCMSERVKQRRAADRTYQKDAIKRSHYAVTF